MKYRFFIALAALFTLAACNKERGCMDPASVNYNAAAQVDDGSCRYAPKADVINTAIQSCQAPFLVVFSFEGSNLTGNETYSWNFGNGQTSNQKNPSTTYLASGTYTVNLTIGNGNGSSTTTYNLTLNSSYTPSVFFDFYAESNNYRVPALINFRNYSQYVGNFKWEFGDNSASIETSPAKIYTTPGNYTVKLEGTCDSTTYNFTRNIQILGPPFAMEITQINLNLNQNYAGSPFYIEILYDGVSRGFTNSFLISSFPYSFYLPLNLFSGSATINNLTYTPPKEIRLRVWQENINEIVKSYTFTTGWWQSNYYPAQVKWDDNTNLVLNYY